MKIVFDRLAEQDLNNQIGYLIDQGAPTAARKLETRISAFVEMTLAAYPRTGTYLHHRALWETWVPRTRFVIWYRLKSDELQVVRIWHAAQDRTGS